MTTLSSLRGATSDKAIQPTLSILGQRWAEREYNPRDAVTICQQLGVAEIIGRIMAGRGIAPSEAAAFLSPTLRTHLPDPFHLKDMDKAARRIAEEVISWQLAVGSKESSLPTANCQLPTIAIFGDYDVDGATSCALLVNYFRALGIEPLVHIPDRMKEGYGPNTPALLALKERGAKLVITVDCGQMAFAPLKAAKEAGLDVIVADHHKGDVEMPEAFAIVNPNRFDETSPHKQLAAVGVVFLLLVAVNKILRDLNVTTPDLMQWLDIVALGTICDVVPLTGANRALVTQGLKIMRNRQNTGINAVMDVARLAEAPDAYHAGFVIGPRINAGGRVGKADLGVRLLTATDAIEAKSLAQELSQFNEERKAIESLVQEEALQQATAMPSDAPIILVAQEGWHPGVIGVVAGRLKEKFHKPVAVVALSNGIGKASARSVTGVDLGNAIVAAVHVGLLVGGGGHAMAAGFTVEEANVNALRDFLSTRIQPEFSKLPRERSLWIDASIAQTGITVELVKQLEQLGPFGASHPQVRVAIRHVRAVNSSIVGDGHVRTILVDAGMGSTSSGIKAMAFRSADTPLGQVLLHGRGKNLLVAGNMRINSWQGRENVDFFIEDATLAE